MVTPTVAEFKAYFDRDFPYGSTSATVKDADIQKALDEAALYFNDTLFSEAAISIAYLYLTAHLMVMNLRASTQGIAGNYSWLESSKSVGSVSTSSEIPEAIKSNPILSALSKTNYGAKYLSMLLPALVGQIFTSHGATRA